MMRRAVFAALLLTVACASSSPVLDSQMYVNQPGDPIEITVEGLNAEPQVFEGQDYPFNFFVVVANNSDDDVTVTQISVFQQSVGPLVVQPSSSKHNETIEPAKEHNFEVKLIARPSNERSAMNEYMSPTIALRVVITLSNGDRYLQEFAIPIRR